MHDDQQVISTAARTRTPRKPKLRIAKAHDYDNGHGYVCYLPFQFLERRVTETTFGLTPLDAYRNWLAINIGCDS